MPAARGRRPYRILIPLANPRTARDLVRIGAGIANGRRTEITALGIVEVPEAVSLSEGATQARTARRLLQRVLDFGDEESVEIRTLVRIGRNAADGVIETVGEEGSDLLIFGWGGPPTPTQTARAEAEATELTLAGQRARPPAVFSRTIDAVVRESPCDIAVVKQRGLDSRELDPRSRARRTARRAGHACQPRPGEALRREDRRAPRGAQGHRRARRRARAGRHRRLRPRARRSATRHRAHPRGGQRAERDRARGQPPRPRRDGGIGAADERLPRWPLPVRDAGRVGGDQGQVDRHRGQDQAGRRPGHLRGAACQRGHPRPRRCLRRAQPLAPGRRRQVVRREHVPCPRVLGHPQARWRSRSGTTSPSASVCRRSTRRRRSGRSSSACGAR